MSASMASLADVASFVNGYAFKQEHWEGQGKPIIRIQNLTGSGSELNRTTFDPGERYHVSNGDILVSWSATLDVFEWSGEDALVNQHIFKVSPDYEVVDKRYLLLALRRAIAQMSKHTRGSTMKHVNRGDFLSTQISLPSKDEQKRIATILDKADAIRRKRQQAIQLADEFLRSVFLEMFGDPVKNPKKWDMAPIGSLVSGIDGGWSPKCSDKPADADQWGVLKLSAVTSGEFIPSENKALPEDVSSRGASEVAAGDVLFTRKNTMELVAACAYVFDTRPKLMFPDTVFRFVFPENSRIHPLYLALLLQHKGQRRAIQKLASGAAGSMPNISKAKLKEVLVPLPPLKTQMHFCEIANRVFKMKRRMIEGERDNPLFESLAKRAFRGVL